MSAARWRSARTREAAINAPQIRGSLAHPTRRGWKAR
jgi:hypothetical protein